MTEPKFVILLVEDDPDDVFFVQEAFKHAALPDALRVVRDGEEAIAYLLGQGAYIDRALHPLPALILLDLKLPRMTGLELLEWRRRQPSLLQIPAIALSSSQSDADMRRAYEHGANSFLFKPLDSDAQLEMVKTVVAYWIGLNKLPKAELGR